MWPKILMQLVELLPHATRLVPVADKILSQRNNADRANQEALAAMAEGVRDDLGQVTKANAGLYRQLQEQGAQIAEISEDLRRARTSIEQHNHRLEALDPKLASLAVWVKGGISVIVILLAIAIWLLARAH